MSSEWAPATDAEWDGIIARLTAISDGDLADRTITPWEARVLLGRIGALQVWALERLAAALLVQGDVRHQETPQ